jgi:hypothetical protein
MTFISNLKNRSTHNQKKDEAIKNKITRTIVIRTPFAIFIKTPV